MKISLVLSTILFASVLGAAPPQVDRDRHVIVISLDGFPASVLRDSTVPLPVLRKLIKEGGVADGLKPVNPTVTWPNHTAMVTGVNAARHGVIYNGLPVRGEEGSPIRVEPWADKTELVKGRTVYDAAHDAGLTTAEVDWVAIYRAASIDWSFAEVPVPDGAVAREMMEGGVITDEELRAFAKAPITFRDEMWMRAAVHIIEKHRPNLLLLHLLTTDSVQHRYGADSLASQTALILADRQVQRILDAVNRAGIRDRTTLLVVSDHGFKTFQHRIRPNAVLREKGLIREKDGKVDCDAWVVAEGGTAMVYVTREARRETTLKTLEEALPALPGVVQVIRPPEYERYGYPEFVKHGRMADMVLVAAPGYAFEGGTSGEAVADVGAGVTPGTHGYVNSDPDMRAILVAWGVGIPAGSHTGVAPNVDVAATVARLLGVALPGMEGKPLTDLLKK